MFLIFTTVCVCVQVFWFVFLMPLWPSQKYRRRPNLALILFLFPSEAMPQHTRIHIYTYKTQRHTLICAISFEVQDPELDSL